MLKLDRRSRVFALLAEELCAAGKWEEAAEVCKKGLLFHPDHLGSRALLGQALKETGETDQSKRIFLQAAEDIRKISFIFNLLSEFAAASGNNEIAGQYAGIYEAFQASGAVGSEAILPVEPHPAPALPPNEEASELGEATEELQVLNAAADSPQDNDFKPLGLEDILLHLTQRIEGRFPKKIQPARIFSEEDKIMLKQKIVAVLSA
jgi:tetratricopeptide (TPR) repeat protein